jgi:methionine-rich copper-binding protein CopC
MTSHRAFAVAAAAVAAALAAAWGAPALAHAELEQTTIADDGEIAAAPESFSMTFSEPVALAGVTLALEGGAEIPVDFTASREPAASFSLALPALEPGRYDLTWRALGADGHVMTDTIDFTVTGAMDHGARDAHEAQGDGPGAMHDGQAGGVDHDDHAGH